MQTDSNKKSQNFGPDALTGVDQEVLGKEIRAWLDARAELDKKHGFSLEPRVVVDESQTNIKIVFDIIKHNG